jgi:hypothetical protein
MTLANAAKELDMAYNTASNWQREFQEEISAQELPSRKS